MNCYECDRRASYMAADPEMYRGEDSRCDEHRPSPEGLLRERLASAESQLSAIHGALADAGDITIREDGDYEVPVRELVRKRDEDRVELASANHVLDILGAPHEEPGSDGGASRLTMLGRMRWVQDRFSELSEAQHQAETALQSREHWKRVALSTDARQRMFDNLEKLTKWYALLWRAGREGLLYWTGRRQLSLTMSGQILPTDENGLPLETPELRQAIEAALKLIDTPTPKAGE